TELASIGSQKRPRLIGQCRWILPHSITAGWLDLDHFRAKIRQKCAAIRPGDIGTQVQYLDSRQRTLDLAFLHRISFLTPRVPSGSRPSAPHRALSLKSVC